ncbi:MAG: hypothetical protein CO017_07710 [Zetaproteobacteria bacterium CG_4_8_14_3_um_filter_59_5]|nr:MAG: hypothetical protein CO017_07710 [Zetaproteobacteria bacterium CG_4_8_14_3_um_filter_59_5]
MSAIQTLDIIQLPNSKFIYHKDTKHTKQFQIIQLGDLRVLRGEIGSSNPRKTLDRNGLSRSHSHPERITVALARENGGRAGRE